MGPRGGGAAEVIAVWPSYRRRILVDNVNPRICTMRRNGSGAIAAPYIKWPAALLAHGEAIYRSSVMSRNRYLRPRNKRGELAPGTSGPRMNG